MTLMPPRVPRIAVSAMIVGEDRLIFFVVGVARERAPLWWVGGVCFEGRYRYYILCGIIQCTNGRLATGFVTAMYVLADGMITTKWQSASLQLVNDNVSIQRDL